MDVSQEGALPDQEQLLTLYLDAVDHTTATYLLMHVKPEDVSTAKHRAEEYASVLETFGPPGSVAHNAVWDSERRSADAPLGGPGAGASSAPAPRKCTTCEGTGHSADRCPTKSAVE